MVPPPPEDAASKPATEPTTTTTASTGATVTAAADDSPPLSPEDDGGTATATTGGPNDIYQHSNYVYILHPEHSWIPAQVTDRSRSVGGVNDDGNAKTVVHLSVPQYRTEQAIQCDGGRTARSFDKIRIDLADAKHSALYPNRHLPLQNVNNEGELQVVEDMVDLPFLHEVCLICCVYLVLCALM